MNAEIYCEHGCYHGLGCEACGEPILFWRGLLVALLMIGTIAMVIWLVITA